MGGNKAGDRWRPMTRRNLFSPLTTRRNVSESFFTTPPPPLRANPVLSVVDRPRIDPRLAGFSGRFVARPSWFGVAEIDQEEEEEREKRPEAASRSRHDERRTRCIEALDHDPMQIHSPFLLLLLSNSEEDDPRSFALLVRSTR